MVTFIPSKRLVSLSGVDYELLSFIINRFVNIKKPLNLKLERANVNWSGFWPDKNLICIDTKQGTSLEYITATILHELRHAIQSRNNVVMNYNYVNYEEYYNSPEERDARSFETLTPEVCNIYKSFKRINIKNNRVDSYLLTNLK